MSASRLLRMLCVLPFAHLQGVVVHVRSSTVRVSMTQCEYADRHCQVRLFHILQAADTIGKQILMVQVLVNWPCDTAASSWPWTSQLNWRIRLCFIGNCRQ